MKHTGDGLKSIDDEITSEDGLTAPINNIGKSFIKQLKIFIQGKEVIDSGDLYAYSALLNRTELW